MIDLKSGDFVRVTATAPTRSPMFVKENALGVVQDVSTSAGVAMIAVAFDGGSLDGPKAWYPAICAYKLCKENMSEAEAAEVSAFILLNPQISNL